MIIAVDFDGTIVQHKYPAIGLLVPGAKETINALVDNGNDVFLWTMRDGLTMDEAKNFLKAKDIHIEYFNESPGQFCLSPKQYANIYIDDAALGAPLYNFNDYVVIDWVEISKRLYAARLITHQQFIDIQRSIF